MPTKKINVETLIVEHVTRFGYKVSGVKGLQYYWDSCPVVCKDKCALGVAINGNDIIFGDIVGGSLKCLRNGRDLSKKQLAEVLADMEAADAVRQ